MDEINKDNTNIEKSNIDNSNNKSASSENEKSNNKLVKSGVLLSVITLASRIMGVIREITKATFLGTGILADAYTVAYLIPNLLRKLFAESSVTVAFIPTFKDYVSKSTTEEKRKEAQLFLSSTFTLVTFLTTCIVILGIVITPFLMPLFCEVPDASAADYASKLAYYLEEAKETTVLTRIMFPYLIVISIAALFQGILNVSNIFAPSGFTPVLFNGIVVLATYLLSPFTANPARAMSIGVITGGCVQALFQLPFIKKTGWKIRFTSLKNAFTNPGTKKVIALIVPTIVGMAAYNLNNAVSTSMAKRVGLGIASSLEYSLRLQELILGIFAVSIGTVILPDLSGYANKNDWNKFNKMLIQAIKIMILISIPVTAYSLISGREIISLIYKNKVFNEDSVNLTFGEFRFHIAGLLFIALNRIISPAFYAQKETKIPTRAGLISFASNILLVLILSRPMGGNGIALALSLASVVNTVMLFIFMNKTGTFEVANILKNTIFYIIKISIYSIIAALPCYFINPILVEKFSSYSKLISQGLPVLICGLIFATIGILELIITKDEIMYTIIKKFKK